MRDTGRTREKRCPKSQGPSLFCVLTAYALSTRHPNAGLLYSFAQSEIHGFTHNELSGVERNSLEGCCYACDLLQKRTGHVFFWKEGSFKLLDCSSHKNLAERSVPAWPPNQVILKELCLSHFIYIYVYVHNV